MQTDAELLRQYVEDGYEPAFSELVRRHLGLVYSAAVRQVGGNPGLAEDIAQTVFIHLARQAPALAAHDSLVGWLHTCTRYTSLRALRDARRRQHRELTALAMEINDTPQISWDKVRPLLDEVVGRLNSADRQAVLLRYFQGRSHREVGAALGVTEDAARVRVDRALEKLRGQFARRGIVTTGTLLGETILAHAGEAEPVGLAGRVKAATAVGTPPLGWGGLILSLILMSTKKKIMIAAALLLLAGLLTIMWPKWAGSPSSEHLPAQISTNQTAILPGSGKSAVQAPILPAAPVTTVAAVEVTKESPASAAASQPLAGAPPMAPPPPAGRGSGGAGFGRGGNSFRDDYRNLFQKLNFTLDQQDAFLKILNSRQDQTAAANQAARSKFTDEQYTEILTKLAGQYTASVDGPPDPWTLSQSFMKKTNDLLGITAQIQAINDNADAQLRQALGSEENYQTYQTYTNQAGVRQWVNNAYGNALQSAGVPGLSADQQEALVAVIAQSMLPGDMGGRIKQLPQVIDQASAILTPDQIEVLKTNPMGIGLAYGRLHPAP